MSAYWVEADVMVRSGEYGAERVDNFRQRIQAAIDSNDELGWPDLVYALIEMNRLDDAQHLIAVHNSANRSKSDKDPAEWMPPRYDLLIAISHEKMVYQQFQVKWIVELSSTFAKTGTNHTGLIKLTYCINDFAR